MFDFLIKQEAEYGLYAVIYPEDMTVWGKVVTWVLATCYKKRAREYGELLLLRRKCTALTEENARYSQKLSFTLNAVAQLLPEGDCPVNVWGDQDWLEPVEYGGEVLEQSPVYLNLPDDVFLKAREVV